MSNTIQFLETLGRDFAWNQIPAEAYATAVNVLEIDENQKQMLQARDHQALNRLLGGRAMMSMHVATPDGGETPEETPSRRDDDEQVPDDSPQEADRPK